MEPAAQNAQLSAQLSATHAGARSQEAAPSDVSHDAPKAEQADDKSDAVDLPELPHVVGDGIWKNQVLPENACARTQTVRRRSVWHAPLRGNAAEPFDPPPL